MLLTNSSVNFLSRVTVACAEKIVKTIVDLIISLGSGVFSTGAGEGVILYVLGLGFEVKVENNEEKKARCDDFVVMKPPGGVGSAGGGLGFSEPPMYTVPMTSAWMLRA